MENMWRWTWPGHVKASAQGACRTEGPAAGACALCSVVPRPLCSFRVAGLCPFLGRGTRESLKAGDLLVELEKRPATAPGTAAEDGRGRETHKDRHPSIGQSLQAGRLLGCWGENGQGSKCG